MMLLYSEAPFMQTETVNIISPLTEFVFRELKDEQNLPWGRLCDLKHDLKPVLTKTASYIGTRLGTGSC